MMPASIIKISMPFLKKYRTLSWRLVRAYYEPLLNYDIYAHLFDFTRPVLIIHGEADRVVPISYSRRAARYYAQATLRPIPGAGHGFYGRNEQVAIQLMLAFLSQSQSNF
ncbi:hypothetical protein C6Y13_12685 [Lactiplantibacillus pentosus]|nr:hypothetical protein C6Y13_12685 [Lactiplantibacillus pentosus]